MCTVSGIQALKDKKRTEQRHTRRILQELKERLLHIKETNTKEFEARLPVVLGCDVNFVRKHVLHRLVVTPVSELQLVSLAPSSTSEELVAEADTKDRCVLPQGPAKVGDRFLAHRRVTGSVRNE